MKDLTVLVFLQQRFLELEITFVMEAPLLSCTACLLLLLLLYSATAGIGWQILKMFLRWVLEGCCCTFKAGWFSTDRLLISIMYFLLFHLQCCQWRFHLRSTCICCDSDCVLIQGQISIYFLLRWGLGWESLVSWLLEYSCLGIAFQRD